ncbi:MAG: 2,3-bisphosphoglycerate-independent phosphoglycerate mutase, partial [Gaiellaceae bacterium]
LIAADGVSPQTAHTTNPVPIVITDREARLRKDGELADLAPTALTYLALKQPQKLTGRSLT